MASEKVMALKQLAATLNLGPSVLGVLIDEGAIVPTGVTHGWTDTVHKFKVYPDKMPTACKTTLQTNTFPMDADGSLLVGVSVSMGTTDHLAVPIDVEPPSNIKSALYALADHLGLPISKPLSWYTKGYITIKVPTPQDCQYQYHLTKWPALHWHKVTNGTLAKTPPLAEAQADVSLPIKKTPGAHTAKASNKHQCPHGINYTDPSPPWEACAKCADVMEPPHYPMHTFTGGGGGGGGGITMAELNDMKHGFAGGGGISAGNVDNDGKYTAVTEKKPFAKNSISYTMPAADAAMLTKLETVCSTTLPAAIVVECQHADCLHGHSKLGFAQHERREFPWTTAGKIKAMDMKYHHSKVTGHHQKYIKVYQRSHVDTSKVGITLTEDQELFLKKLYLAELTPQAGHFEALAATASYPQKYVMGLEPEKMDVAGYESTCKHGKPPSKCIYCCNGDMHVEQKYLTAWDNPPSGEGWYVMVTSSTANAKHKTLTKMDPQPGGPPDDVCVHGKWKDTYCKECKHNQVKEHMVSMTTKFNAAMDAMGDLGAATNIKPQFVDIGSSCPHGYVPHTCTECKAESEKAKMAFIAALEGKMGFANDFTDMGYHTKEHKCCGHCGPQSHAPHSNGGCGKPLPDKDAAAVLAAKKNSTKKKPHPCIDMPSMTPCTCGANKGKHSAVTLYCPTEVGIYSTTHTFTPKQESKYIDLPNSVLCQCGAMKGKHQTHTLCCPDKDINPFATKYNGSKTFTPSNPKYEYPLDTQCAVCGKTFGLHKFDESNCPMPKSSKGGPVYNDLATFVPKPFVPKPLHDPFAELDTICPHGSKPTQCMKCFDEELNG